MASHPRNPNHLYTPWQVKVKFHLAALNALPRLSSQQQKRKEELEAKLYRSQRNLTWFRERRDEPK